MAAEPGHRTITRNDVARAAGVSSAVVSYVVNNGPKRVAPATEERVRAAVKALGYRPNLTARALSSGSTAMIGLVLIDLLNPFFAESVHAIEAAAVERDHAILIAHSNSQADLERNRVAELEARGVDGLLLSTVLPHAQLAEWVATRRSATPIVLLNYDVAVPGLITIGPNFRDGARQAVEHLLGHGHRRIGLVTGSADSSEHREAGWRQALTKGGRRPGPIGRSHFTREGGYAAARQILTAARPPTAIFAVSDLLGIGVLRAADEFGLRVPDDLAVVCFDGTSETEFSRPPLTAVRQPLAAMAAAAIDCVLNPTLHAGRHLVFDTDLIIRRSCGCVGTNAVGGRCPTVVNGDPPP